MFSFQLISTLLISATFYTYLSNIIFSRDLDFNVIHLTNNFLNIPKPWKVQL